MLPLLNPKDIVPPYLFRRPPFEGLQAKLVRPPKGKTTYSTSVGLFCSAFEYFLPQSGNRKHLHEPLAQTKFPVPTGAYAFPFPRISVFLALPLLDPK